jgi:hypothetical protein
MTNSKIALTRIPVGVWAMPVAFVTLLLAAAPALLCAQSSAAGSAQAGVLPEKDAYLREPRPGNTPRMFAPGRISDAMSNRDMAISPSGKELFYTIQSDNGQVSMVLYCHWTGGAWSKPEVAPFSGKYNDLEPAFSYDGNTMFFASNRPVGVPAEAGPIRAEGAGAAAGTTRAETAAGERAVAPAKKDYDIWMVKRRGEKWGQPVRLDTVINTEKDEFYPSVARNGNLYFTRVMEHGKGKEDIAVSEWKDGRYQEAYSLPGGVNTEHYEFNAFVDPDEQFLLFSSFGRKDDIGGGDLYLSYKNAQGEWAEAVHLDSTINSTTLDFSPYVSLDKKYLFFTSSRMKAGPPFAPPLNFERLRGLLDGPGNGLNDIYWVEWPVLLKKYTHDR